VITPRTDIKEGSFAVLQDPAGARIGVFQKAECRNRSDRLRVKACPVSLRQRGPASIFV